MSFNFTRHSSLLTKILDTLSEEKQCSLETRLERFLFSQQDGILSDILRRPIVFLEKNCRAIIKDRIMHSQQQIDSGSDLFLLVFVSMVKPSPMFERKDFYHGKNPWSDTTS